MHHNNNNKYNNNSKNDKSPWGSFANAMHLHDLIFISISKKSSSLIPNNTREIEMSVKSVITIIIMLLK